jgi:hypothetical protein
VYFFELVHQFRLGGFRCLKIRLQARIRVAKRIKERRATLCDLLANNLFILSYEELTSKSHGHSDSFADFDGGQNRNYSATVVYVFF